MIRLAPIRPSKHGHDVLADPTISQDPRFINPANWQHSSHNFSSIRNVFGTTVMYPEQYVQQST
jgi:hypothetical protein